jgi:hypothetical protein
MQLEQRTLPGHQQRVDLRAAGLRDRDIAALLRSEGWSRVRPGTFILGPTPDAVELRHLVRAESVVERLPPGSDHVVSHGSAAVLLGLPCWGVDLDRVHLTRPGLPGIASSALVCPHRGQLTDGEVTVVNGIAVTTPARTVLDIARRYGFEAGVVTADGCVRLGLATPEELAGVVEIARRRGSAGCAARVVQFADGAAESAGESRSRVLLARSGLPKPVLQHRILDADGRFVARVDFLIEQLGTVGEFDGLRKYQRDLEPGETPYHAVIREKLREDAIRDSGPQMVRWIWSDLDVPDRILGRFLRAFGRAGHPAWVPAPPRRDGFW